MFGAGLGALGYQYYGPFEGDVGALGGQSSRRS